MELNEENLADLANWFFDADASAPVGISQSKDKVALQCFSELFLRPPEPAVDSVGVQSFAGIVENQFHQSAHLIDYTSTYPKYEFLRYLTERGFLLHGSKIPEMTVLEPKEQMNWKGSPLWAVFATRDAFWPMYFALLNRDRLSGSIRNGCFLVEDSFSKVERFYFFSVNRENLHSDILSDGFIYILRGDTFRQTTSGSVRFDEWASEEPVPVIARLQISSEDFPFRHQITGHEERESIFRTWLRYKERLKAG